MCSFFARCASAALLSVLLASAANAQLVETWSRQFSTPTYGDFPYGVAVDAQGNVTIVGGEQMSNPPVLSADPVWRAFVLRYDTNGTQQWLNFHDPIPNRRTHFSSIASTPAGGFVVAGGTASLFPDPVLVADLIAVSYDASGNVLWSTIYDTPGGGFEAASAIACEPSGATWIVGSVVNVTPSSTPDWLVMKYDPNGVLLWTRRLNGVANSYDELRAIVLDGQGGAYVAGTIGLDSHPHTALAVARYDAAGTLLWKSEYAGIAPSYSLAFDLAVDASGVYCAGQTSHGQLFAEYSLLKFDSAGNLLWVSAPTDPFAATKQGSARRIAIDASGDVVVVGGCRVIAGGQPVILVERYGPSGALRWAYSWDGGGGFSNSATHVAIDEAGELFVAGRTSTAPSGYDQAVLLRMDLFDGTLRSQQIYGAANHHDAVDGLGIGPKGAVTIVSTTEYSFAADRADVFTNRFDSTSYAFCFGDGTGASCPCGNTSVVGDREGCLNSNGYGGKLTDGGGSSLSSDGLQLFAFQMPIGAGALFFQGDVAVASGAGTAFGDGLLCASGSIVRLALKIAGPGGATFPSGLDPSLSVQGNVTTPGVRIYQVWYRDSATFCTSATNNLTNGMRVTWTP